MATEDPTPHNINEPQPLEKSDTPPKPTPFTPPGPVSSPNSQPSPTQGGSVKNGRRKWLIMAAVLVVIVAAVIIGWLYYTNPQRVVADSLSKSLGADSAGYQGKLEFASKESSDPFKLHVDFNGEGNKTHTKVDTKTKITAGALDINLDANFLVANGETYFKLGNAKQLGELATSLAGPQSKPFVDVYKPLIEKLDNKWVKVDQQENGSEATKCSQALSEMKISDADSNAIRNLFKQHEFIVATEAGSSGFIEGHYNLALNEDKAESFTKEVVNLESFKKIKAECHPEEAIKSAKTQIKKAENPSVKAELWVNKLTHKPTKLHFSVDDKEATLAFTTDIELNKKTNVTAPSDATPLSKILQDFQAEVLKNFQSAIPKQSTGTTPTQNF